MKKPLNKKLVEVIKELIKTELVKREDIIVELKNKKLI